jgi:hypothetical protein
MNEQKQLILFLLTRDLAYLPEGYPDIDKKKWLKKTDLQRLREAKRLTSAIITYLKEKGSSEQTSYLSETRTWCPPNCPL